MNPLQNLQPELVWKHFQALCAIPHGSGNMGPASAMCIDFATAHNLAWHTDEAQNVIIKKPATPGYENAPTVILQGHLDMVCQQDPDRGFDFMTEGLELAVDGDWLYARGTTLGGDDGIAVAMMLAVLEANDLPHPALECVFTTDEETGMDGARTLDFSRLTGRQLINIDSEEEGVFTVCCAGGVRAQVTLPVAREAAPGVACRIMAGGLLGGHSGCDIDKGRASAPLLLGRVLDCLQAQTALRIVSMQAGTRENVICPEASVEVILDEAALPQLEAVLQQCQDTFRSEYAATDPDITLSFTQLEAPTACPLTADATADVIWLLLVSPQGVVAMSADFPGLVRTSLNLGVLQLEEDALQAVYLVRSMVGSEKQALVRQLQALFGRIGCSVSLSSDYSAWEYRRASSLREAAVCAYRNLFGTDPVVGGTHGGLECGLFCGKCPELDAISIGPNLVDIHTPRERLSIASTERTWQLLCGILQQCR